MNRSISSDIRQNLYSQYVETNRIQSEVSFCKTLRLL